MANRSIGTLTVELMLKYLGYTEGLKTAKQATVTYQQAIDGVFANMDKSYQSTMQNMRKHYAQQEREQIAAIQKYTINTNTMAGLDAKRKQSIENLNKVFTSSGRESKEYYDAMESIEASYIQGVRRIEAYNTMTDMTGTKTRLARHEVLNLSYQLQDVFVGLSSGQKPMTVFIQQGSQMAGIASSAGLNIKNMAKEVLGLGAAVGKAAAGFLLNPYIAAFVAVTGSAILVLRSFKEALNDMSGLDDYIKGMKLSKEETKQFQEAVKDLGGTVVGTKDILKAFNEDIGFTRTVRDFGKGFVDGLTTDAKAAAGVIVSLYSEIGALDKTIQGFVNGTIRAQDLSTYYRLYWQEGMNGWNDYWNDIADSAIDARKRIVEDALLEILEPKFKSAIKATQTELEQLTAEYEENMKAINNYASVRGWDEPITRGFRNRLTDKYNQDVAKLKERQNKETEKENQLLRTRAGYMEMVNKKLDNEIIRTAKLTEEKQIQAEIDRINEHFASKGWAELDNREIELLQERNKELNEAGKLWGYINTAQQKSSSQIIDDLELQINAIGNYANITGMTADETTSALRELNKELDIARDPLVAYRYDLEDIAETFGKTADQAKILSAIPDSIVDPEKRKNAEEYLTVFRLIEKAQEKMNTTVGRSIGTLSVMDEVLAELVSKNPDIQKLIDLLQQIPTEIDNSLGGGLKGGIQEYVDSIRTLSDNISAMVKNSFAGLEDQLVSFVTTGKFSFKDLANSIISDLVRIAIRQAIMAPFLGAFGFTYGGGGIGVGTAHTGGIVGSLSQSKTVSPSVFVGAERYHSGGIVDLSPGEVPIIAKRGEMILTEQQQRHAFSKNSGFSVTVINNTPAKVSMREQANGNGGTSLVAQIDDIVSSTVSRRGSRAQQAVLGANKLKRR